MICANLAPETSGSCKENIKKCTLIHLFPYTFVMRRGGTWRNSLLGYSQWQSNTFNRLIREQTD